MKQKENNALYYIRIIGVLLLITMCTASLLAVVNSVTKDVIAQNEKKKTEEAISSIFTGVSNISTEQVGISDGFEDVSAFYKVSDGGSKIGYYAEVAPIGFKGEVKMIIGLDSSGSVIGIKILSHSETVGIGDAALGDAYLSQFAGKNDVSSLPDAISGATYSSNAVREGVKTAIAVYKSVDGGVN